MAESPVVLTIRAKRAEIERTIAHLEEKLKEARTDLMHVNLTLRLFEIGGATGDPPPLQFPVYVDLHRLFQRGEMVDLAKAALAASPEPLTTRQLAAHVIRAKGWDDGDKALRVTIAYRLVQALNRQALRGRVRDCGKRGGVRVWAAEGSRP